MAQNRTPRAIPVNPEAITVGWLNDALGEEIGNASVVAFEAEEIGAGVGVIGIVMRLSLQYDRPSEGPESLVAKFASSNAEAREIARMFGLYEKETLFYQELAADTPVRKPRCYFAHHDSEMQDTVILLEDLSAATMADQLEGCSLEQAEIAVRELATLHGFWWEHPRLETLSWIQRIGDPCYLEGVPAVVRQNGSISLELLGDTVPAWYWAVHGTFVASLVDILRYFDRMPLTLAHGDYRLDNLMFGVEANQPVLTVIDWQVIHRGTGTFDLGYFLSQSLTVEDRRAHEDDLLSLYHECLVAQGVQNFSLDQLHKAYRWVCLYCLVYPLLAGAAVDLESPRAVELIHCLASRAWASIEDHNAFDLIR